MAVSVSAVARVLGIGVEFVNLRGSTALLLPQRVAVIAQGNNGLSYPTTKFQALTSLAVANVLGFGSPAHLAARELLPDNGDGLGSIPLTIYPLAEAGGATAAVGDITPTIAATVNSSYRVRVGGVLSNAFTIAAGDSVATVVTAMTAAINAVLEMPFSATDNTTDVILTSKWRGDSANGVTVEIIGDLTIGNSFAITQPVGGATNPDVQDALDQIGEVWETLVLNCLDIDDTTALDTYETFGAGRWGDLTHKPLLVFTGNNEPDEATAVTITDARKDDFVNVQLVGVGSVNLPFVVAARQLARIAVLANENPPHDYGSQPADGLIPGTDGEQWQYTERDAAVKAGSSTIEVVDGVINISDVVTMYHPTGDPLPAYRYVVDIVKIMNVIYNVNVEFASAQWDGAPLLGDTDFSSNPTAKRPRDAKAALAAIIDGLGAAAVLVDVAGAKASILAGIDSTNPKRLNMDFTAKLSGNTNIKSIDFNFGFNFG